MLVRITRTLTYCCRECKMVQPLRKTVWWFLIELTIHLPHGFPAGTSGKQPTCQCRRHKRPRFNPWVARFPGEGNGNPLQYSCLENPMDRGAWQSTVHRVANSWTWLKQLSMHAPHDSSIPLLGTYPSELKTCVSTKTRRHIQQLNSSFPETRNNSHIIQPVNG